MPARHAHPPHRSFAAAVAFVTLSACSGSTPTTGAPPDDGAGSDAPPDASPDVAAGEEPDAAGARDDADRDRPDVPRDDVSTADAAVRDAPAPDVARMDVVPAPDVPRVADVPVTPADAPAGWHLVWSDEFAGADGAAADPRNWTQEVGGGGWGNAEREFYTAGTANAFVSGGSLVIRAVRSAPATGSCWYGPCQYTSARLITRGHFQQSYGRFEARIRLPGGQGLWPAFWMLGADIATVSWPTCGEIDIMENIGREPAVNHGSVHGPGPGGATNISATYALPGGARFDAGYHVFAVEWEPSLLRWYVDGTLYETRTPADDPAGARWVFDHPFFLLLNVAVGGNWPGDPDGTTTFPQEMRVDYVRAYAR